MALTVTSFDQDMTKTFGWWSSNTHLMYIHDEIIFLTKLVSERMAVAFPFVNVEIKITWLEKPP